MHEFLQLIRDLLQRSLGLAAAAVLVCGLALAAAYLAFRSRSGGQRRFPWGKAAVSLALAAYLAVLAYATLLRNTGMGVSNWNFHLFRAWREAWNSFSLQTWLNVLLNIALFAPLGVLLPLLFRRLRRWYAALAAGFGVSLAIEVLQYVLQRGTLDVDDLFANTLGCLLGYCLVMALRKLPGRDGGPRKGSFAYLAAPLVFAAALGGIFAAYALQPYGNLEEAPSYTGDLSGIRWEVECPLEETAAQAAVYRIGSMDLQACHAFGEAFAERAGITFPDVYEYDNLTVFANHATGDFLDVDHRDGSYTYRSGAASGDAETAEVDEQTLRGLLASLGISVPDEAVFTVAGEGVHTFTMDLATDGGQVWDGTLECRCLEGPVLAEVENRLVQLELCGEEPALSPKEAYEQMARGAFASVGAYEHYRPDLVSVTRCSLDYRVDSKGFYQPVYVFTTAVDGQEFGRVVIPALR